MEHFFVTAENLRDARESCIAIDQRNEMEPGCETWGITYAGGQRGQMTVSTETGRGAVMWGGDSEWGNWDEDDRTLHLDNGAIVNEEGEIIAEADESEEG